MNKNTKYLIFDFDGVIADSINAIAKYEQKNHPELTLDQVIAKLQKSDESNIFLDLDTDKEKIETRKQSIINAARYLTTIEIPLFHKFLSEIHKIQNTKLAIVTSNSKELVEHLLKNISHDFEFILGVQEGYLKSDKIKFICEKWEVKMDDIFYFTDTQRDVYQLEGHINKSKIYGCAWGWHGYDRLIKVLPKSNVLQKFTDIKDILF